MTIDDNIDFLNEAKKFYEDIANEPSLNETLKTYFTIESLESAITIMHKYQKIEEIYKNWSYGADSCDCMKDIERVVEDGNDN